MITYAAIDIGSNAMRLAIGRFNAGGQLDIVATCRAAVRLGKDVFRQGRISPAIMEQGMAAFAEFETMLSEYRVTHYRAVATSALRDAENSGDFIRRVERATGIHIEVISGDEEARLVHRAVAARVPLKRGTNLLLDIGGGSCEVSLICRGDLVFSESVNMGTVRLLEMVRGTPKDAQLLERLIGQYARRVRARLKDIRSLGRITRLIGTGGNIDTLGELRKDVLGQKSSKKLTRAELRQLMQLIGGMTVQQRITRLELRPDRADVIVPAMTLIRGIMEEVGAGTLTIPKTGLRDGVLYDLHSKQQAAPGAPSIQRLLPVVRSAALEVGRHYAFDEGHAVHASRLALQFFDQTRRLHKLGIEARALLEISTLLHDVGYFINGADHQKHSWYIINASSLPGLTTEQHRMIALIARYHRGEPPSEKDEAYAELSSKQRQCVRILSAIVRLVEDLDREHSRRVPRLRLSIRGKKITIQLPPSKPLLVERWGISNHKKPLEEALRVSIDVR